MSGLGEMIRQDGIKEGFEIGYKEGFEEGLKLGIEIGLKSFIPLIKKLELAGDQKNLNRLEMICKDHEEMVKLFSKYNISLENYDIQ